MGRDLVGTLRSLRGEAVSRLVQIRASIDPFYERIAEAAAIDQFDLVLAHVDAWLATGDREAFEDSIGRWAAMRFGDGFTPEGVVNALIAVGDVLARVAHDRLVGEEAIALSRAAIDASFAASRLVTGALAEELAARRAQLRELAG